MPEGNTPTASGTNNKMLYIIGALVVVVLLGWLITRGTGGIAGSMAGVDTDRNIDGSTTYSNDEGTVTVGGNSMPENWPSDAPANYAGASIQYSGTSNPQTGEAGSAIVYSVNASMQSVTDFYRSGLQSNGWTLDNTANVGGATVLSASKGDRNMGIYIADTGNGMVTVTAGIEM